MAAQPPLLQLPNAQAAAQWLREAGAVHLSADSRHAGPGQAFVAWPGYAQDGRAYVASAFEAGAPACLVEQEGVEVFSFSGERVASLMDLKQATGEIASAFYGHPSAELDMVGVTGTNGKTSCTWWMAQAGTLLGRPGGIAGTLGMGEPPSARGSGQLASTGLTTPDPITLHRGLRQMRERGLKMCALEASSIGIVEHRLEGLRLKVAVFTNLTQDHLDYHGTMQAYWQAKRALFFWPGLQAAVINTDDARGRELARELSREQSREQSASSQGLDLWTIGTQESCRLRAVDVTQQSQGLSFDVVETSAEGSQRVKVRSAFIGDYNVHNLLAVIGAWRALGVSLSEVAEVVPSLSAVPGRMQSLGCAEQPLVVVDYAHTSDALEKALSALEPVAAQRGGRLWCVFGCGGDRDRSKRPLMGSAAASRAEILVVTSDNPRNEAPEQILQDILIFCRGEVGFDGIFGWQVFG